MTSEPAIDLQIGGLTCRESAAALERILQELPGVQRAIVSYGTRRGRVIVEDAAAIADVEALLIESIQANGYEATTISRLG